MPDRPDPGHDRFEHAVVGVDFSPSTEQLLVWLPHVERLGISRMTLVHVIGGHYPQAPEERHRQHYLPRLQGFAERLGDGLSVTTELRVGHVGSQLEEAASTGFADVIVAGSHGHTPWRDLFLGSTVLELARTSRWPVLLVPLHAPPPAAGGGIVLATDGSPSAAGAERIGAALARHVGGVAITVLHPRSRAQQGGEDPAAAAQSHLSGIADGVLDTRVDHGPLPETVAALANERAADLIVVGARGRTPLAGLLLGSTAEHLLRTASRPVLLVRQLAN